MKTIKFIISSLLAFVITFGAMAQDKDSKTESFKVYGNCESCKARIEKALKIDGINKATWDVKSKILTVSYNPSKISIDGIHKKVATVGHDTEKLKADDKVYASLPGCCQYERKK